MSVRAWRASRTPGCSDHHAVRFREPEGRARLPRGSPCSPGLLTPADTEPPPHGHSLHGECGASAPQNTALKHSNTTKSPGVIWESYTITKQMTGSGAGKQMQSARVPSPRPPTSRREHAPTPGAPGRPDSMISEVFSNLVDSVILGRKPAWNGVFQTLPELAVRQGHPRPRSAP